MLELVKNEIPAGFDAVVEKQLPFLKSVEDSWQPSDALPDMKNPQWREEIQDLRQKAASLSNDVLVVLVGNVVTEEALPSYQTWLNRTRGLADVTGTDDTPWGRWTRGWTAEENRHGELLSRYLYLSGRVNMRSVEVTTHNLIKNGFDIKSDNDPYMSIVYAAFQERATKISHANTGKLAEKCGDPNLSRMCALIAGDEARHEEAYKRFFGFIVETCPSDAVIAFADMMRQKVAMPARLMSDGTDRDVFTQFAVVAQRSGIYTTSDYAGVVRHLVDYWRIGTLKDLSAAALESQEFLCELPDHYLKKADRIESVLSRLPKEPFSWIFDQYA